MTTGKDCCNVLIGLNAGFLYGLVCLFGRYLLKQLSWGNNVKKPLHLSSVADPDPVFLGHPDPNF